VRVGGRVRIKLRCRTGLLLYLGVLIRTCGGVKAKVCVARPFVEFRKAASDLGLLGEWTNRLGQGALQYWAITSAWGEGGAGRVLRSAGGFRVSNLYGASFRRVVVGSLHVRVGRRVRVKMRCRQGWHSAWECKSARASGEGVQGQSQCGEFFRRVLVGGERLGIHGRVDYPLSQAAIRYWAITAPERRANPEGC
jgi:hypothetical protein